jgi:hypothetical protein
MREKGFQQPYRNSLYLPTLLDLAQDMVTIYTGTITFAKPEQQHIENDMNSFTGCFRAVVFLFDENWR